MIIETESMPENNATHRYFIHLVDESMIEERSVEAFRTRDLQLMYHACCNPFKIYTFTHPRFMDRHKKITPRYAAMMLKLLSNYTGGLSISLVLSMYKSVMVYGSFYPAYYEDSLNWSDKKTLDDHFNCTKNFSHYNIAADEEERVSANINEYIEEYIISIPRKDIHYKFYVDQYHKWQKYRQKIIAEKMKELVKFCGNDGHLIHQLANEGIKATKDKFGSRCADLVNWMIGLSLEQ